MSSSHNRQVSVLVVDRDAASRKQIHELLLSDGYGCRTVAAAAAALQAVREKAPDLLICEIELGQDDGVELYQRMKHQVDCPVVFISESRSPEVMWRARQAGGTFFLSKPVDPSVLQELVDKALWMPHLVRSHIDTHGHQLKPPTFAPTSIARGEPAPHVMD